MIMCFINSLLTYLHRVFQRSELYWFLFDRGHTSIPFSHLFILCCEYMYILCIKTVYKNFTHWLRYKRVLINLLTHSFKPKFHVARLVTSRRHDTTRSTCRASRARVEPCCSTSSTQPKCTRSTRRTCRVETWRAKWNLGLTHKLWQW